MLDPPVTTFAGISKQEFALLFDELPAEFEAHDIDGACAQVAAIEAISTGTLHAFGESLASRGADIRRQDEPGGLRVIADGLVCQL